MKPLLFVLSGLPGSGKTTLSQFLARKHRIPYVQIDAIEQGLRDVCRMEVVAEGYELAYRIAAENLRLGLGTVVDSCNPIDLTRTTWEKVARDNHAELVNIEVICSDKDEHRRRIEGRGTYIPNLRLPTWEDVEKRLYHPWTGERIVIDTAHKTLEKSQAELEAALLEYLNLQTEA